MRITVSVIDSYFFVIMNIFHIINVTLHSHYEYVFIEV
jgi:hypothetical protein